MTHHARDRHRRAGHHRRHARGSRARRASGCCTTPRSSSSDGRVAWVGPAAQAPDADQRRRPRRAAPWSPGFVDSHAHLVFAGDRSAEFAARMAGTPYDGGGIATTVARHAGRDRRRSCARCWRRGSREMRAQGTTTVEVKSGYGLTVADEARALRIAARAHRRDHVPRRARRARGVRRPPRRLRRPGHRRDARGLRAARPLGRRVLRAASAHAFDGGRGAARCSPPGARPGSGCACTATSSARARASGWPSSSARPAWTTARYLTDADVDALARRPAHRGDAAARRGVLHPLALPGRPAAAGRRGRGRARHRLQPGHLLLVVDAVRGRAGRPGDAPDARARRCARRPPAARRRCAATTSADRARWRAPT